MTKILGLALYGSLAASNRVRLGQYVDELAAFGIDLEIQALLDNRYLKNRFEGCRLPLRNILGMGFARLQVLLNKKRYDAAILHCELFPLIPGWLERALLSLPYIYDFDDAFYLRYRSGSLAAFKPLLGNKFDTVISGASAVTAGNEHLATYARKLNPNVAVLPSVVNTNKYFPTQVKAEKVFTIGWIGSPSTAVYLSQIVAPLARLGAKSPLRFVVVGGKAPLIENVQVIELPWNENTEVDQINSFDVGVMPLPDDEWARGKCAFKLIQYMACGVPVVASKVGANVDVVTPDCGFLVENELDWFNALNTFRLQATLRNKMGDASRKRVEQYYSVTQNLPIIVESIRAILRSSNKKTSSMSESR